MVCTRHASLFQRARGGNLFDEEISIPNWGGHWSRAFVCNDVRACVCGCMCVSKCMSVRVAAAAVTWEREVILICLFLETVTRSVIPLLTIAVVPGNENGRRLDVNTPLRSNSVQIPTPTTFFLSCHSVERSCVLSYSDWPAPLFDLGFFLRHEGAPWRLTVGMTSIQNTFCFLLFGQTRGGAFKGAAAMTPPFTPHPSINPPNALHTWSVAVKDGCLQVSRVHDFLTDMISFY